MLSRKWILLFAFSLFALVPLASLSAQDVPTISVALPAQMRNVIDEAIFDDFEAAHGVQVYVNYVEADVPPPSAGMDAYLEALTTYASAADVLYLNTSEFSREATDAGFFLDLSPLTSTDAALNPDDFFPAAWESVQWDNAVWALPLSLDVTMLIYDPDTFDQAGIAYPNERWTMEDLANAAEALTQYDANGNVSVPGLSAFGSTTSLFRSLYGRNFYDDVGDPVFTDPALEDLLTRWKELQDEGVVGSTFTGGGSNQVPMRLMGSFGLSFPGQPNATPPVAVALPGGRVGMSVTALGVSSGTQQPELAYALAQYMTTRPELASGIFGGSAARQSLVGVQPEQNNDDGPGGGARFVFGGGSSPEAQAALNQLLPSALTLAEQGYSNYINVALNSMTNDGVDAHTALQNAEASAISDQQAALAQQDSVNLIIATPVPPVVLQGGEIALKFGIQSFGPQLPNEAAWRQLVADFSANDPEVGNVQLDTDFGGASTFAERDDCFYLSSNAVPSLDSTTILNLDPYLDTDPNFDPNDVVGGLMTQLQKDNRTWAYPLVIQAQTMNYSANIFEQAGVPLPEDGWTIDQFIDALHTLRDYLDKEPFVPEDLNGEALMMLIAAYGGLPVDYRTTPATLNFTDPATIDAVQQVLDLVKDGYIKYQSMVSGGGFRIVVASADGAAQNAIGTDSIGGFRRFLGGGPNANRAPRLVSYPSGIYTGASYTIGTGYISATAQNPDACYRWLSYIAQHVDVLGSMPARLSQITDPAFAAALGNNIGFYQQYAQLLSDPNTIVFPSAAGGNANVSDFIVQFWLNRAFDNYISNNADLTAEMTDAQTYAAAFNDCVAALPPDSQPQDGGPGTVSINQGIIDCATTADPSLSTLFGGVGGG